MLLSSTLYIPFNSKCWGSFILSSATTHYTYNQKPSGNCLLLKCIPEALTVICMFYYYFVTS